MKSDPRGIGLNEVPNEVLLSHIIPLLSLSDLLALTLVNKRFGELANDNRTWQYRLWTDHHFATTSFHLDTFHSFKDVYKGLIHIQPYVWGSTASGRLGRDLDALNRNHRRVYRTGVSSPLALYPSGRPIRKGLKTWKESFRETIERVTGNGNVSFDDERDEHAIETDEGTWIEIIAGTYGFAMRSSTGKVQVWGQLDGTSPAFEASDWSSPNFLVAEPTIIPLPFQVERIAFGAKHLLLLDRDNLVWEMRSFGSAFHHTSPLLCAPSTTGSSRDPGYVVQIAGGHEISACLTSSGDVIAWTPPLSADFDALDQEQTGQYRRSIAWGKIPDICKCLPTIPTVQAQHKLESTNDTDTIVKIACGASFVVALKANGQIWVWHAAQNIELNSWIYVEGLSGKDVVDIHVRLFSITSVSCSSTIKTLNPWRMPGVTESPKVAVTTIADAHLVNVHSTGLHTMALTATGKVYSWGNENLHGQLGNGSNERSESPRLVRFGDAEDGFAYSIAVGERHAGALLLGQSSPPSVLRLRGGSSDDKLEDPKEHGRESQEGSRDNAPSGIGNHPSPTGGLRAPMFRVRFAGRHAVRGGTPRQEMTQNQESADERVQSNRGRGGPSFRIGFAGRGGTVGSSQRLDDGEKSNDGDNVAGVSKR